MPQLYEDLKAIKKDHYDPNDRIVFELNDHDFYLDNQGPGFTLYNLQIILRELDISNFFCLLVTNQPDYNEYTKMVQHNLTTDDNHIRSITTILNRDWFTEVAPSQPNLNLIEKPYCLLSRQSRPHRTFFMSKIFEAGLENQGIIGYNNISFEGNYTAHNKHIKTQIQDNSLGLLTVPAFYQKVLLRQPENRECLARFQQQHKTYKNFSEDHNIADKINSARLDISTPIQRGFLYVGLETQAELTKVFTTRIALRGILERRPFVILGCPGTLSYLQEFGFQTFNQFWDEDYDQLPTLEARVDSIIQIVKYISAMNLDSLQALYDQMTTILDHNYELYHNRLIPQEEVRLHRDCEKNLRNES